MHHMFSVWTYIVSMWNCVLMKWTKELFQNIIYGILIVAPVIAFWYVLMVAVVGFRLIDMFGDFMRFLTSF